MDGDVKLESCVEVWMEPGRPMVNWALRELLFHALEFSKGMPVERFPLFWYVYPQAALAAY